MNGCSTGDGDPRGARASSARSPDRRHMNLAATNRTQHTATKTHTVVRITDDSLATIIESAS